MNLAAGEVDMRSYFNDHPELADLVSLHHQYVEDWVRVFYATVYILDSRQYMKFMF